MDVDTLSPSQRGTLSVVPTLQTSTGQTLLGSKAFDYLKAYQEDTQLDCYNGAGGAFSNLVFSDYTTDDGKPEVTGFYGAFEPLP